jgi:hypothetical protein
MCKYDHRNWSDLRLDPAMILFHGVVQVGTTTDLHGRLPAVVELIPHPHVAQRGVRGLVAIHCDPARLALVFQRLAKESLGAFTSRRQLRCDSTEWPRWSTARYRYFHWPPALI